MSLSLVFRVKAKLFSDSLSELQLAICIMPAGQGTELCSSVHMQSVHQALKIPWKVQQGSVRELG
jgi:hypothetical protein